MTQQSILTGLIIGIVALLIVAAGVMVVFTPGETEPAPGTTVPISKTPTLDEMKALAAEIAGTIDGDALAALKPGDENTSAYIAIRDQFNAARAANPNILYIYTMRKVGNATEYVVDADYGDDGVPIGYVYTPTDADTAFLAGFTGPSAEPYYVDDWGDTVYTATSGYAPIKDASGAVVGLVGVDVGRVITEETLKALAADAAARIDGDALAALKPGDEDTPGHIAVRDQLRAFKAETPGVLYVYTMRKAGNATEYIVNADYGSSNAAAIGEVYVPTEKDTAFLAGFTEPSAEPGIYTEEWGSEIATIISGYAPVKDSSGAIVGLVGVDLGSAETIAKTPAVPKVPTLDEMKVLAADIAARIDGDALAALKPGDESTPAFTAVRDRLNAFRASNPEIVYAYTMRKAGNTTESVVDADYGERSDAYAIGEDYSPDDQDTEFLAGFAGPSAEIESYIYGYAPIRNASGAGVGMLVCIGSGIPIGQERMEALAVEVAGTIDGDAHAALKPGDEKTPAFIAIRDRLAAFRTSNPEIAYIYTVRMVGNDTEYVVDADYGSDNGVAIGGGDYTPTDLDAVYLAGLTEPAAEIYSLIVGYAPVKNSAGAGVGLVCINAGNPITPERASALAANAATRIDGDALAALRPGDENAPAFTAIHDQLRAFKAETPGVVYVYTMRKAGESVEYVVDADYGNGNTPGIGEVCNDTSTMMLAGFTEPSAESKFYVEQWGNETATALSGYAPVRDSTGAVVGLVGVDLGILH